MRRFGAGVSTINGSSTTGTGAQQYAITVGLRWPASWTYAAQHFNAGDVRMRFPDLDQLAVVWKKYRIHWVKLHLHYESLSSLTSNMNHGVTYPVVSNIPLIINSVPWNESEDPTQILTVLNQRQGSRSTILTLENPYTTYKIYPKMYDEIPAGSLLATDQAIYVKMPFISFKDELDAGMNAGDSVAYGLAMKWATLPPNMSLRIVPEFKVSFTDLV